MSTGSSSLFAWKDGRSCLTFSELQTIKSSVENALLFEILLMVDIVAILLTFLVVCYEHWERSAKRRAKRNKFKTTITKEYLRRLKLQDLNMENMKNQDMTEYYIDVQFPNRNHDTTGSPKGMDTKEPTNQSKHETKEKTKEAEESHQMPILFTGVEQMKTADNR
ncbi:hypothetical protein M3Y97_00416800 [Aphelenchoides bicaudatus]|nr:hypothetical protein M3Y97_00416800 [Aphelenchoides bicaudatus]